jgi:hypothetical protein
MLHSGDSGNHVRQINRLQFLRKWSYGKHEEEVAMVLAGSS